MAEHNDTGMQGEALACRHLEEQGFAIMETNWRRGKYEVDIIAYKEGLIVFAEVKTRHRTDYGNPEEFVDHKKQKAYIRLADAYVSRYRREEEVRCDRVCTWRRIRRSGCSVSPCCSRWAGLQIRPN